MTGTLLHPTSKQTTNQGNNLRTALSELRDKDQALIERFYAALTDGGLVNASLSGVMSAEGAWQRATTAYADDFLAFVHDPR